MTLELSVPHTIFDRDCVLTAAERARMIPLARTATQRFENGAPADAAFAEVARVGKTLSCPKCREMAAGLELLNTLAIGTTLS